MGAYLHRIFDSLSQVLNVLIYSKRGTANHSISGDAFRFGRKRTQKVIDTFFECFGDVNHCRNSHMNDVRRAAQLMNEERWAARRDIR